MTLHRSGRPTVVVALLLVWASLALARSVAVSSSDDGGGEATVTYTVLAPSGKTAKDLHFQPGSPKKQNLKAPIDTDMPAGWTWSGTGTSDHQFATTQGSGLSGTTAGNFAVTFQYGGTYQKFEKSLKRVKVTVTDDGTDEIKPGVNVIEEGGPTTGGSGGTGPYVVWPLSFVDWKEPGGGVVAAIDDVVAFRVETSHFGGQAFRLYTSTALSQTESGPDNPLGLDIDTNESVPAAWGLEITPTPGRSELFTEVQDDLDAAIITVAIPDDLNLVGETFYLVAASDSDGDGIPDLISRPLCVTIQNQGSGMSGVEVLDDLF